MKATEFCYWLQGYFELQREPRAMDAKQVECVQKHLSMVFIHEIDPSYPQAQQPALSTAHSGHPSLKDDIAHGPPTGVLLRC